MNISGKCTEIVEGLCGALSIGIALATPFLNSRRSKWGAMADEVNRPLPGDELVPMSKGGYTHAITVHATAAAIWPWILQLGQGRGGFYSYDFLENLVGCDIHSADSIIPEFQHLKVGDKIPMHPKTGSPFVVAAIQPGTALVMFIRVNTQTGEIYEPGGTVPEKYQNSSWVLFLDERDDGTTRLISRSRNDWNGSLANSLIFGILGSISLIMDRKMLQGISKRAEALHRSTT